MLSDTPPTISESKIVYQFIDMFVFFLLFLSVSNVF